MVTERRDNFTNHSTCTSYNKYISTINLVLLIKGSLISLFYQLFQQVWEFNSLLFYNTKLFYHRSWFHPYYTWAVFPVDSWPCWRSSQWVLSPGYYHRMVSASQNAPGEPAKMKVNVDKKHQTETRPYKKLKQNIKHQIILNK